MVEQVGNAPIFMYFSGGGSEIRTHVALLMRQLLVPTPAHPAITMY